MGKYNIQRDRYSKAVDRTRKFPTGVMFESNTPPANALDIGATVANSAATGASIGGAIGGPVGAAVGGAAMGVYSLGSELVKRQKTISSNRTLDQQRKAYEMYGDKALDDKDQPLQAKKGLKANRYETVEMEKGEVHVDGETLETHVGTIPHEQGGNDVEVKPGDFIVNSQTDPEKRHKILALAEAAKGGSLAAKAMLQQEADKLPKGEVKPGQKMVRGGLFDRFKKNNEPTEYTTKNTDVTSSDLTNLSLNDLMNVRIDENKTKVLNPSYDDASDISKDVKVNRVDENEYALRVANSKTPQETSDAIYRTDDKGRIFRRYQTGTKEVSAFEGELSDTDKKLKGVLDKTFGANYFGEVLSGERKITEEDQKKLRSELKAQGFNYDKLKDEGLIAGNVAKEDAIRHKTFGEKTAELWANRYYKTKLNPEYSEEVFIKDSPREIDQTDQKLTLEQKVPVEAKKEEKTKTETSDSPFRYTNVLYNTLRGLSGADKTAAVPLRLDRYKDKTDVEQQRQDILMQQKIMNRNADTAYTSKGESGSSKAMVSAQTTRSLAELNKSKYERSAAIQKANTDLANTEAQYNTAETARVNDENKQHEAKQREFTGAASEELVQQKLQAIRDTKMDENDKLSMKLMNSLTQYEIKDGNITAKQTDAQRRDQQIINEITSKAKEAGIDLNDPNGFEVYKKTFGKDNPSHLEFIETRFK